MNAIPSRILLGLSGLLAAGSLTSAWIGPAAAEGTLAGRRPNIVLVLTDDQGYGDLGRNGNKVIKTPNLDRMYDESVHFEDFRVSPTCSPTRSSIMAGRHEFHSGVTHTIFERERLSLKATTLAQILKSAGYATGVFGKWHMGDEEPYQPNHRGFDETFIHGAGGIGQTYEGSCGDAPNNSYFDPVVRHNGTFVKTSGYCTDVFFRQAGAWIESTRQRGPFFCYIATNAPHAPHNVPEQYAAIYSDLPEIKALDAAAKPAGKAAAKSAKPGAKSSAKRPNAQGATEVAKFLGMVTNIDENVGKLLTRLKELGIERDTLVVFINDNGGTAGCRVFNAGMRGGKGTASNGGTRAMSLWRWPGTLKPGPVEALTAHLDLFPTFAALAGAKIPEVVAAKLEGFSLLPLLTNPQATWHDDRMLFAHVGRWTPGAEPEKFGKCSVRWRQYLYFPSDKKPGLYDIKVDPGETNDLAGQHPDVVARLAAAYDRWWTETLPELDNEAAYKTAPKTNPFKELYWKQFQGPGPNNAPPPEAAY